MGEKLDQTITNICNWIDEQLDGANCMYESSMLPEMVSALAELVTARANRIY